ncbi:unnamed protein product [Macrosiphum euphorbiae]|uniref:Ubiquitin-like domain-containing protein n=2 Tax=Macrosiphum euphorbiae TaxID=13131 RepID=A0AAV0VZE8_9HEMI|nr:unnamed protein product [Macrosiphum euphorbiae]
MMDIGLTDPWITLTIKAPNQQINDHTIKCKLDWSVAKLKGYIHETYPNKPKTEDQRLIYSGQLLTDGVILKDVLRPYDDDGQLNRTVHLVCSSSSCCIPLKEKLKSEEIVKEINGKSPKLNEVNYGASTSGISTSAADTNQEVSTSSNNKQDTKPTKNQTKSKNNVNRSPLTPEQLALEQILWVNKMYAVQMAEYWQSVASSLGAPIQLNTPTVKNESPPPDVPINNNNNNQPADQNIPANNPNINIQDAGPNQDWLDWLYVSSRVFIFISVIYFYSSPGRFLVVAGFALILYLYQSGILRHLHEHNRRRFQLEQQEQHVDDNRNLSQEQNGNNEDTTVRQNERLITTLWTVVSTFFTSLIPQQPDII